MGDKDSVANTILTTWSEMTSEARQTLLQLLMMGILAFFLWQFLGELVRILDTGQRNFQEFAELERADREKFRSAFEKANELNERRAKADEVRTENLKLANESLIELLKRAQPSNPR